MSNNNILFDANSSALDSPAFMLDKQLTVIATGMAPDDYITFEILQLLSGDPSRLCGCRIINNSNAVIDLVKPLTCAMCGPEVNQQEVRLTALSTFVILDAPQGVLVRAIYHGTGIDDGTVKAWYNTSETPDLNDAMRGCAPFEVWEDTGETRCNIISDIMEIQQSSSCGSIRWIPGAAFAWVNTGVQDCDISNVFVQIQQVSPCGDLRWVDSTELTEWLSTGGYVCENGGYFRQERNQCGDIRLTLIVAEEWLPTGELVCDTDVNQQERNQCGDIRLVNLGPVVWLDTGVQQCEWVPQVDPSDLPFYTTRQQQMNECGAIQWTVPSAPIAGPATGAHQCVPGEEGFYYNLFNNPCGNTPAFQLVIIDPLDFWSRTGTTSCTDGEIIQLEERSPCGDIRWIEDPAGTPAWHDAGGDCAFSCDPDTGFLFRVQESGCCGGGQRLVQVFDEVDEPVLPEWLSTGTYRCNSGTGMVELQERSQCNEYRWIECSVITQTATGETRIYLGVSQIQVANPCGELSWVDIPPESIIWTLTGVQACVGGFFQNQETDGFGNVRTVTTTEPCGCGDNPILQYSYDSDWQLYTGRRGKPGFITTLYSFLHGLGVTPDFVTLEFRCVIAQGSYAIGDIVVANVHAADQQNGVSTGWAMRIDPLNIILAIDYNNGASLHSWNNTSNFRLDNGKWEFRIRGYA